jgi:GT2 family glycosyltransferase
LYSQNYFSHLGVYRRELVQAVGGFRAGYEGSQDYDLVLRCVARIEDARDVVHIPEVLYHWRMAEGSTAGGHEQKSYASEAGRKALQDHFDAAALAVHVTVRAPGIYRHRWAMPSDAPLVSLIVPTRDGIEVLRTCIESILEKTSYRNYEILIVDNQSSCPRTLAYLAQLAATGKARVLAYDRPFNYSAINNFAAAQARGSILGLINNDVEVINADWLTEMVSHVVRPDVGCVGAKLYYPNDTIQHGGVVCGIGGIANHAHRHFAKDSPGYFGRLWLIHNLSAVTGAALVVRKPVFDEVGGLDEAGLPVAFNDVDLCLKVKQAGYRNLWTPFAELYHHESVSRGSDEAPEKRQRFLGECAVMYARWDRELACDPYYNPNLTRQREDFSLNAAVEA